MFSKIWGGESSFNVLFVCPWSVVTNGFERVGVGRLFGIAAGEEFQASGERGISLLYNIDICIIADILWFRQTI